MAETTQEASSEPLPLAQYQVHRWEPQPSEPTSNAVADPPATSVAVEPEPEPPDVPDEGSTIAVEDPEGPPSGEASAAESPEAASGRRPIRERLSDLAQQRNAEREQRLAAEIARAKAEGRAEALAELVHHQAVPTPQDQQEPSRPPPPLEYPEEAAYPTAEAHRQAVHAYIRSMIQEGVRDELAGIQRVQARESALAKARERYPNFDALIEQARVPVNPQMTQALQDAPDWPLVMAHLAEHPDEARALMHVDRPGAYAAVARIQAHLNAPAAPASDMPELPTPPRPPPPPPVPPLRGHSGPAVPPYEDLSFMDFFRRRNKEEQEARRSM